MKLETVDSVAQADGMDARREGLRVESDAVKRRGLMDQLRHSTDDNDAAHNAVELVRSQCTDPAARWTGAHGGQAFFAYSTNYLVDVEATTAIRQAEVLAAKRMIERSMERFDLYPAKLMADSAYGSAEMLSWLVYEHGIEPHVTVSDKSGRQDGTFSRDDLTYDHASDVYVCPGGKLLTTTGSLIDGATLRHRASKYDCQACRLKPQCCPKEPARYVPRSVYEGARDMAREIAKSWDGRTSRRLRKKIEMLFAHLKRILKLDHLRLRGPNGARDEFILAATAQNLRKMAKLIRCPP